MFGEIVFLEIGGYVAKIGALVTLVAVLLSFVAPQSAANILPNGDFETGTLAGWGKATRVSVSLKAAYEGAYGAVVNGTGLLSQNIAPRLTAGMEYTITLKTIIKKKTGSWGSVGLSLDKYEDCGAGAYGSVRAVNDPGLGWQSLTLHSTGFTPSQLAAPVYLCVTGNGFSRGLAYVDSIELYPAEATGTSTPTPTASATPTPTKTSPPTLTPTLTPTGPVVPSLTPTKTITPSTVLGSEWTQFGANAQHTQWLPQDIGSWSFKCLATGLSLKGKAQVVTGGSRLYVATNSNLVALNEACGQVWANAILPSGSPVYDNEVLYALTTDGHVYRLNAATGAVLSSTALTGASAVAPTLSGATLFVSVGNRVYALNKDTLAIQWQYDAGSPVVTAPAVSAQRGMAVVVSQDLYAHGIGSGGARLWRVKPTPRTYGTLAENSSTVALADTSWPVIAEQHGIVFIRYQLNWSEVYRSFTADNAQLRNTLTSDPSAQPLFALNLSDGSTAFVPNIGAGGFEKSNAQGFVIDPAFPPVIRILPDGKEVAYSMCRGRGDTAYDSRWDSSLCELMLDNATSAGYTAGQVRFIAVAMPPNSSNPYLITDEQPYLIGSGNMLLGAHWHAGHTLKITDRSDGRGSWSNKIQSSVMPFIVNIENPPSYAPCTLNSGHYCSGNLFYDESAQGWGGRLYPSGFWVFWGSASGTGENSFTISKNLIIYAYRGAVMVLQGTATGIPATPTPTPAAPITPTQTNTPVWTSTLTVTPTTAPSGSTQITSFQTITDVVGQYKRFEGTLQLSRIFTDGSLLPYYPFEDNPDGITIDAQFTAPSGAVSTVPVFYYQDYARSGTSSVVMTPGAFAWRVRFAPSELGTYQYRFTVKDKTGVSYYPGSASLSFQSMASDSKGFVRVNPVDSRYFSFSNGASFIPIGSGRQWWKCCGVRTLDYEAALNNFGASGINTTRIWIQNDGYALTLEGHFDAYKYPDDYNPEDRGVDLNTIPKGTQINQRGAKELDLVLQAAERNGVYLQLCSHTDPYWIWESFSGVNDPKRLAYWRRNFRYLVGRYGYSTSVLAWEHWNEEGHVLPNSSKWEFYANYLTYQKETDPYKHLLTTSQGSQSYSPAFWSQLPFDIANYHDYMMSSRYPAGLTNDEANFVSKFSWCIRAGLCSGLNLGDGTAWSGPSKPWIWGELDVGTTVWNEVNPKAKSGDARLRMLHNTTWAGLFSPLAASPLDWYWDQEDSATTELRWADRARTAPFFDGVSLTGMEYALTSADAPSGYTGKLAATSNAGARVYAMFNSTGAYAWIQNRDYTWYNSPALTTLSNVTVSIPAQVGQYTSSLYDPHTGAWQNLGVLTSNGNLAFTITTQKDVAFKGTLIQAQQRALVPAPARCAIPAAVAAIVAAVAAFFLGKKRRKT